MSPFQLPYWGPYGKKCPSPEPPSRDPSGPQERSPPDRAPTERDAPFLKPSFICLFQDPAK